MHIELTEVLCCPDCGPGHGLVALVERMEGRRILDGRLDCPVCERRHAVRDGIVRLDGGDDAPPNGHAPADPGPEPAQLAHALLLPPDGPETLLIRAGALGLAQWLREARPEAALVTFGPGAPASGGRIYPIVAGPGRGVAPIRPSTLTGIVGRGPEDARTAPDHADLLRFGGRVVVLDPGDAGASSHDPRLRVLAADPRAWVAEKGSITG